MNGHISEHVRAAYSSYKRLNDSLSERGGVSSLSDVQKLTDMGLYGAILGKALYTGDLDLSAALRITGEVTE